MTLPVQERITRKEIESYKREVLEQSVLVTLDDAAAILAVSPRTVRRRVEEGLLPTYSDTSDRENTRFLASELRDYVRRMRTIHRDR
jgi:predicted ArsR family transcriptional regulator